MEDNRIIIRLASACNKVKTHPYLETYDPKYIGNFFSVFFEMADLAYHLVLNSTKHFTKDQVDYYEHTHLYFLRTFYHDTRADMSCVRLNNYTPESPNFNFKRFTIYIQNIIKICEALANNEEILELPTGATGSKYAVFRMIKCENGYYKMVTYANSAYLEATQKLLDREIQRYLRQGPNYYINTRKHFEARLQDIQNNTEIFYCHEENNV